MQFGKVLHPEKIDFSLPNDHLITQKNLSSESTSEIKIHLGCAKWNRQDLKNFYPRGTKDELSYYSSQFNSIELNATFYNMFPRVQFEKWRNKTTANFKFFPKLTKQISHLHQLNTTAIEIAKRNIDCILGLEDKLGMIFLQMNEKFAPSHFKQLETFIKHWPTNVPLAVELRHTDWFNTNVSNELYALFEANNITNIITDTAGRRDLLHNALTTNNTFIRFVGANHSSDYSRLDNWITRLTKWKEVGLKNLNFFVHQNTEIESVKLSAYFLKMLNKKWNLSHHIPKTLEDNEQFSLF